MTRNDARWIEKVVAVALIAMVGTACDTGDAEPRAFEDHLTPGVADTPPDPRGLPPLGVITPVVFVPSDESVSQEELDAVAAGLVDLQVWYARELETGELRFDDLQVVHGSHDAAYYLDHIWDTGPGELENALGYSPWSEGHIVLLVGAGLLGWAGGAGTGQAGFAVLGLESLTRPDACAPQWWCNSDMWRGTAIHELGHALTLPHSEGMSIMAFHGEWQQRVLLETEVWPEKSQVRALSFFVPDGAEEPPHDPGADGGADGGECGCGDVDYFGYCDGDTLVWCEAGALEQYDCGAVGMSCGWQDEVVGNNCL